MDELVFAVPADELWNLLAYKEQGLIDADRHLLKMIVQKGLFRKRNELEEDPLFKQLISYAVISCGDSFLLFKRSSGQREKRLVNLYTLGAGGHMNPVSPMLSEEEYLIDELKRELHEELTFSDSSSFEDIRFMGFINDDTIPVGRFHIGLFYNIRVSDKNIHVNETDKMTASWIEKPSLAEYYEGMETWTKIIFDNYIK